MQVVHQLVAVTEIASGERGVWSLFDEKMENALNNDAVVVSIMLHPEMGHGMELVRWLEKWHRQCRENDKTLISIAENKQQFQCLEMSHPDMGLQYVSSVNDLSFRLKVLTGHKTLHHDEDKQRNTTERIKNSIVIPPENRTAEVDEPSSGDNHPAGSVEHAPVPSMQTAGTPERDVAVQKESMPSKLIMNSVVAVHDNGIGKKPAVGTTTPLYGKKVEGNAVVEIAGEYQCDHCGVTRMYCKGDVVVSCENRECNAHRTEFTLIYDLF